MIMKTIEQICMFLATDVKSDGGMIALCLWDAETPYLYFFKHGLEEEKVVS